jgi:hypothetical protein
MKKEVMKEEYELPRISMRGIVLEGSLAAQSPVKSVTLTAWETVPEEQVDMEDVSFQVW